MAAGLHDESKPVHRALSPGGGVAHRCMLLHPVRPGSFRARARAFTPHRQGACRSNFSLAQLRVCVYRREPAVVSHLPCRYNRRIGPSLSSVLLRIRRVFPAGHF